MKPRTDHSRLTAVELLVLIALSGCGAGDSGPQPLTVGGTISGLTKSGLVLVNGTDSLSVAADAVSFAMPTALYAGMSYDVTVKAEPPGLYCAASNGSGTMGNAPVDNVVVTCISSAVTTLHSFLGYPMDGASPFSGVIQGADNNLYCTTVEGGQFGSGAVLKVTLRGDGSLLHSFQDSTTDASNGLVQGHDGDLYGTTAGGGPISVGTLFKISPSGTYTLINYFYGSVESPGEGARPVGSLALGTDGNFYGVTAGGYGPSANGTIFSFPSGFGNYLFDLSGDGATPHSGLIPGSDGSLYGTTYSGGAHGLGTVFKITVQGVESVLYSFGGKAGDGVSPATSLIQASDGNLYGTTDAGGTDGAGTVFRITRDGTETVLFSFGRSGTAGLKPAGNLLQASDGNLYGATVTGGAYGGGTVFRLTLGGSETVLYSFGGRAEDGESPAGGLIQANDGYLYGTTSAGGTANHGTVFRVTL